VVVRSARIESKWKQATGLKGPDMDASDSTQLATSKIPVLPGYTAKRLLGHGAFGEVWLAQDMCGLFYGVKVIYRTNLNHPDAEAREFAGLRHYLGVSRENENLVQIYFIGRALDHRFFYYAMDLADDANGCDRIRVSQYVPRTLAHDIKSRGGPNSVHEVARLGQSLLRGLSYLHEKHLVHRDIKPSNIIFSRGEPKLTDFGLVCMPAKGTRGEEIGTPAYCPERGKGTHSADLYGLGKVLWVYWTGYDISDFPSLPHEFLETSLQAPGNRLNEVIHRACAEEPSERYQGWAEMWEDLCDIDQSLSPSHPSGPVVPEPEPSLSLPPPPVGIISRTSPFYIRREADDQVCDQLQYCRKQGQVIRIKGPRQSGKTSLVARALEEARDNGFEIIMLDFRQLNQSDLASLDTFYAAFERLVSMSLDPEALKFDSVLGSANQRLTEFMELQVSTRLRGPVLLAMDNVERVLRQPFSPEFFSLVRCWSEFRETRREPWRRFTLLLAYSDDEILLEQRMNHSPFNVGVRIELAPLNLKEMEQLNRAYGAPLARPEECTRFFRLTGGKPFLVNYGLYELSRKRIPFEEFEATAQEETGVYRDQLRRVWHLLERSQSYRDGVAAVNQGKTRLPQQTFLDLQSMGILTGVPEQPQFSCELYARYLSRRLNSTAA
jgi:serine/threonine protein kinase